MLRVGRAVQHQGSEDPACLCPSEVYVTCVVCKLLQQIGGIPNLLQQFGHHTGFWKMTVPGEFESEVQTLQPRMSVTPRMAWLCRCTPFALRATHFLHLTGFLALLRDSLWQVLWNDVERTTTASASSSSTALALIYGSSSSSSAAATGGGQPAVSAAALLRTEFASSAGRLYGQLYDRNSRRPFCPPEAFTAEGLVPER